MTTSAPKPISSPVARAIVRDIARGGLAGLVTGLLVAGLGGRIAMRLAALLVPTASGQFTENGNRIGDITLGGSLALIIVVGLLAAVAFGVAWVVISPWLPGSRVGRGVAAAPVAVALGAFGLVDGGNPDFVTLGHDPRVLAVLFGLVALVPIVLAIADAALDARLPGPMAEGSADAAYVLLAVVGGVAGALLILPMLGDPRSRPFAATVIALGALTLVAWRMRLAGRAEPTPVVRNAARWLLVAGTVAGAVVLWPDVRAALALG